MRMCSFLCGLLLAVVACTHQPGDHANKVAVPASEPEQLDSEIVPDSLPASSAADTVGTTNQSLPVIGIPPADDNYGSAAAILPAPSVDKAAYAHLLQAPVSFVADSAEYYSTFHGKRVARKNIAIEVYGSFYINNEPTATGRSNSFHGHIAVGAFEMEFLPGQGLETILSIQQLLPHYRYVEAYYFYGDRVYLMSRASGKALPAVAPDVAVFEYRNEITGETHLIRSRENAWPRVPPGIF